MAGALSRSIADVPVLQCSDCGTVDGHPQGWHSAITNAGRSRVNCDPCYRWRSVRGLTFDDRPIGELRKAVA